MNNKVIPIVAAVIVVVIVAAAAIVVLNGNNKGDDKVDVSAAKIANTFIEKYDGDYDADFSLVVTDENNAKASASVSGGMISEVYVSYRITDKAQELFDASKATSEVRVKTESAMSGLTYSAITEKGSFNDGYGYYGDCSMSYGGTTVKFVSIHYASIYKNVYVESVLYIYGSNYADNDFKGTIDAMYSAIKNPINGTLEQMVKAFVNSCPDTFKQDFVVTTGDNTAQAQTAEKVGTMYPGLVVKHFDNESKAKEYFSTQSGTFKNKVDTGSTMASLTYTLIDGKVGTSTDNCGYYGDCVMNNGGNTVKFVTIHFTGYEGDETFDLSLYVYGSNYSDIEDNFVSTVAIVNGCMSI